MAKAVSPARRVFAALSAAPRARIVTPTESWQSQEKLTKMLTDKGLTVRRIKVDGGCYEAYVVNDKGERMEAYFHPQTLSPVPTKPR